MNKINYYEQLSSPLWQRKKNGILDRDKYTCQCCGDTTTTLHVHHLCYEPNRLAWEYPDDKLVTLCEHCHSKIHNGGEWHEMPEVKLGDVFEFDHSDFTNSVICYHIDHLNQYVYLTGLDNGGSCDTLYFEKFSYKEFLSKCVKVEGWFSEEESLDSSYALSHSVCLYLYYIGSNKVHTEGEEEGDRNLFVGNISKMFANNNGLEDCFMKAEQKSEEELFYLI